MSLFLGIDTSNYTTSVAVCGDSQQDIRQIIEIKDGMRGIRQSDGVFVHLKTLPELYNKLDIDFSKVKAIGVSTRPRSVDGSYMPVFLAGESFARVVSKTLDIPLYSYSHQDGHIMAGIMSGDAYDLLEKPFTAVHLSGGTSEIVSARYKDGKFNCQIIGGTKDISVGQLIDRVGVKLGFKFPCGKEIDRISKECDSPAKLKISVKDGYMNLSGMETQLLKMAETEDPAYVAKSALHFGARSVVSALSQLKCENILFVGGVSSNSYMRNYFKENLDTDIYFATPHLSCDNAMGIAKLCQLKYTR
jgi:N6-L-threonylcarbamoyladenine synthase